MKYGNRKTVVDGIKFDSQAEANRYCELKLLEKAGEINNLVLQPKFVLLSGYKKDGINVRPMYYIADFTYQAKNGQVVEDVKGVQTAVFKLKKKLFEHKYPDMSIKII